MAASPDDLLRENGSAGDSDEDSDAPDGYYRPISTYDGGSASDSDDDGGFGASSPVRSNGGSDPIHGQNPNPSFFQLHVVNGISGLDLNGDGEGEGMEEDDHGDEEEEEREREREREASITRAFREDESRRSAPLTPENAARIVDAMRGVSFQGIPPDWVNRVPEDQWVNQLRSLRGDATPQN